jgi:DNA-binding LytR/AlgR family response regulator
VNLHTSKGSFLVLQAIRRLETRLDPERFIRVHRSYMVNLEAVQELEPWTNGRLKCLMKDGKEVITSRSGAKRLKKLML